jgi:GxxExxY protein
MNDKVILYPDESYAINGACMEVYKTLGNGFLEAVYQESLEIEFRKRTIPFFTQTVNFDVPGTTA